MFKNYTVDNSNCLNIVLFYIFFIVHITLTLIRADEGKVTSFSSSTDLLKKYIKVQVYGQTRLSIFLD